MNFFARCPRRRAFSLVEVVLAMGIISFALLAMFGLVSVSLKADRESSSDTVLATMCRQVIGDLRATSFASLPATSYYFFDRDGCPCNPASALVPTAPSSALYECEVDIVNDPTAADPNYTVSANLKNATLKFMWPVVSGTGSNSSVFYCDIANYGN